MKKKNLLLLAIFLLVLIITLVYGISILEKNNNKFSHPKNITISQAFQHLLYIGLYVADQNGYFTDENINVKIETAGGDAQAFAALASGNADFAQGDPAFVAIANEKGWQGKVIAMPVNRVAIWGVTFDTTIQKFSSPESFKGYTVATYPEPNTSYVIQKQLALRANLDLEKDIKILQVPFGTELATLKNNQADIAQTIEPNVTQVEQQGGKVVFSYPEAWGELAFTGLMTSEKLIENDSGLVQGVINAYEKALNFVHSQPDSTVIIAKKYLPDLDSEIIRTALNRLVASKCIPKTTIVEKESWRKLLDIRIEVGDLDSLPKKDLIDNRFSLQAASQ